jgi:hypothetical protein
MKIILACLMCLVLGAAECFAIDGGPVFGGGSQVAVTGTYAGVMIPIPTVVDPGPPEVTMTDNSLVLFTLIIPKEGLGHGTSAVFRNGISYTGTIVGSADPDSAKLTGILTTSFLLLASSSTGTGGTSEVIKHEYDGNGQFVNAKIVSNTNTTSTATARIRGKSSLTYTNDNSDPNGDSGGAIFYRIKGFKQSQNSG